MGVCVNEYDEYEMDVDELHWDESETYRFEW